MQIERGFRGKLSTYLNTSQNFTAEISVTGASVYDYSCFGVDENNKLSDDRYMIFYNQTASPNNEISYSQTSDGAKFVVNLSALPEKISRLVFTVSIDGSGTMGKISSHTFSLSQSNNTALTFTLSGQDFHDERAIISAEIYKKDSDWRFAAVAGGFNGGLRELLKHYGGTEATESATHESVSTQSKPKTVELRKGQKVNLEKPSGEILINLNWHKGSGKKGLFSVFSGNSGAIDLDLGCLFELKDGTKGSVQALGKTFGRLDKPPYVALDGDDRTGEISGGENLRVNGKKIAEIRRILVYTFIYEGIANWKEADGIVTIKCPGSSDIIERMDEHDTRKGMCALAMLENVNDKSFSVEKLIHFFSGHEEMDRYYHWNMRWVHGRK